MTRFTIGKLSKVSQVSVDTIRFYERKKLLAATMRSTSGYRYYNDEAVERLGFIRRAKAFGFTLDEIAALLQLKDKRARGERAEVKALARQKLDELEDLLDQLQCVHRLLADVVSQCSGEGDVCGCPILSAFGQPMAPPAALPAMPTALAQRRSVAQPAVRL